VLDSIVGQLNDFRSFSLDFPSQLKLNTFIWKLSMDLIATKTTSIGLLVNFETVELYLMISSYYNHLLIALRMNRLESTPMKFRVSAYLIFNQIHLNVIKFCRWQLLSLMAEAS